MDVSVTVADGAEDSGGQGAAALRDLVGWLRRQPELRGQVDLVSRPPQAGEMGSVTELVTVAVGSGGAISVLAGSLRMWLAQPRRSDVRLTLRLPDGRAVELEARRVTDVETLLHTVLDSQAAGEPGPAGPEA